ncbi:hypothetical protein SDJN03_22174, partial [Cucurbita argyrosperma subsp. sororia]
MSSRGRHFNLNDAGRNSVMELDGVKGYEENFDPNVNGTETNAAGWSLIASRFLRTCIAYSSSVTAAILLSELSQD